MKIRNIWQTPKYLLLFTSTLGWISYSNSQLKAIALETAEKVTKETITRSNNTNKKGIYSQIAQVNREPTPLPQPLPDATSPSPVNPNPLPVRSEDDLEIAIKTIRVTGDTILTQSDIDGIFKPLEGKTVSLAELQLAIDDLTQIYLERGYITSRAILDRSSLDGDNIQVRIIEGSVKRIDVRGTQRLENYVRDRVNLAAGTPLNTADLEDSLRLLRLDPLFSNVEASITAGDRPEIGKSVVEVRVTESDRGSARISLDNYSPPSVGAERLGFDLEYRSLLQGGDRMNARFYPRLSALTDTFDLGINYQIPVNARNGTITTGIDLNRNEIIDPIGDDLDDLEIEGESERFNLGFRQPIIRNPRQELALALNFDYQNGQTFLFQEGTRFGLGADEEGETTTSVIRFAQEYIRRQVSGAWALRSQLNLGVGLFGATENDEPIPDGQFFSWLGQIQRVQVLNSDNFLIIQANLQLTPDSLLPSQQFVIGGGQSVRGYRQNVRSGDNGLILSVEDRWTWVKSKAGEPLLTFTPFVNLGTVWNQDDNPNELPDETFIAALGVGFIWQPLEDFNLRLNYAPPLVGLDDKGDNIQDNGLHFSLDYGFSF